MDVAYPAGGTDNHMVALCIHNLREVAPECEKIVLVPSPSAHSPVVST